MTKLPPLFYLDGCDWASWCMALISSFGFSFCPFFLLLSLEEARGMTHRWVDGMMEGRMGNLIAPCLASSTLLIIKLYFKQYRNEWRSACSKVKRIEGLKMMMGRCIIQHCLPITHYPFLFWYTDFNCNIWRKRGIKNLRHHSAREGSRKVLFFL